MKRDIKSRRMENKEGIFSDKDLLSVLSESTEMDDTFLRLVLIELLTRIRKLEQTNFALQALLVEEGLVDPEGLYDTINNAVQYLNRLDEKKATFCDMLKETGITFEQWVNFNLYGSFRDS